MLDLLETIFLIITLMISAPKPENELQRLQALFDYHVLDTEPEGKFDELTALASSICGTPIALISLIDQTRQWFKSHHGLDASETPREVAFCAHAIHQSDVFEIQDSRKDERFSDNPLVTDEPRVIFYAGAPLTTPNGENLGTLCVIDHEPKELSPEKKQQLQILANQVIAQLELRKQNRLYREAYGDLKCLAEEMKQRNEELYQFSNRVAHDVGGPLGQIGSLSDLLVSDLEADNKAAAEKKLTFINSACHSLRTLVKDLFDLSRADLTCNVTEAINLEALLDNAVDDVNKALAEHSVNIVCSVNVDKAFHSQAVRIKQVLYNLVSNGVKYANPDMSEPYVHISVSETASGICFSVKDNGLGIPEKYQHKLFESFERFHPKAAQGTGLGASIIKKHVEALGGKIEFTSTPEGTEFIVDLPDLKAE